MAAAKASYTSSEAAERSGVAAETLRYYERVGLMSVRRTPGGHRLFDDDDLGWIEVLRCLRRTGMGIRDMQRFAELVRAGESGPETSAERLDLLRRQERSVLTQVDELTEALVVVRRKIAGYEALAGAAELVSPARS